MRQLFLATASAISALVIAIVSIMSPARAVEIPRPVIPQVSVPRASVPRISVPRVNVPRPSTLRPVIHIPRPAMPRVNVMTHPVARSVPHVSATDRTNNAPVTSGASAGVRLSAPTNRNGAASKAAVAVSKSTPTKMESSPTSKNQTALSRVSMNVVQAPSKPVAATVQNRGAMRAASASTGTSNVVVSGYKPGQIFDDPDGTHIIITAGVIDVTPGGYGVKGAPGVGGTYSVVPIPGHASQWISNGHWGGGQWWTPDVITTPYVVGTNVPTPVPVSAPPPSPTPVLPSTPVLSVSQPTATTNPLNPNPSMAQSPPSGNSPPSKPVSVSSQNDFLPKPAQATTLNLPSIGNGAGVVAIGALGKDALLILEAETIPLVLAVTVAGPPLFGYFSGKPYSMGLKGGWTQISEDYNLKRLFDNVTNLETE